MPTAETLTHEIGGIWYGTYGSAPCPVCQTERRLDQRALSLRNDGSRLLVFCHKSGCDFRLILIAAGTAPAMAGADVKEAKENATKQAAYEAEQLKKARRLWEAGKPIAGTKGEAYLRSRGITCPMPPTLRWVSVAYHAPSSRRLSAMVANVSTGGVHRTFFTKNGVRLDSGAKLMQGPCSGGAVALDDQPGPLVVCEGIETGLSLLSGLLTVDASVWAALSTSGMKALHLPPVAGELIVAADSDDGGCGRRAAEALASRAHGLGWRVSLWPAPDGQDWNDVLRAQVAK
jgi:hypothetical protein